MAPPPGICWIWTVGLPGRYFVRKGCKKRANRLVPPPSLKGIIHVTVFPERSRFADTFGDHAKHETNKQIMRLRMLFSPYYSSG